MRYYKLLYISLTVGCVQFVLYLLKSQHKFPKNIYQGSQEQNNSGENGEDPMLPSNLRHLEVAHSVPKIQSIYAIHHEVEEEPQPSDKNIFFIESRCAKNETSSITAGLDLNKRQACSIESAARTNPSSTVYILYTCPFTESLVNSTEYVKQLFTLPNVKLWKINFPEFLDNTPLKDWNFEIQLFLSKTPVTHSSIALRYVTLLKYGGTYLDLDIVVIKSLQDLGSSYVVKQNDNKFSGRVLNLGLEKVGRKFAEFCVEEIKYFYNPWTSTPAKIINSVAMDICSVDLVEEMVPQKCEGIKIYNISTFFPVPDTSWKKFNDSNSVLNLENSHGVHMWNSLSKDLTVNLSRPSPYKRLAEEFCPLVYLNSEGFF